MVCFATGGTIASIHEPEAGGPLPAITGTALVEAVPELAEIASMEVVQLANSSSHLFTPSEVFAWSTRVHERLAEDDTVGAVVTMGTATLEEAAYLFDLVLRDEKPVVFTGAMRSHDQIGADGPRNLLAAVRTATTPGARGLGVLVVLNGEIHSARDVSKADSDAVDAFVSRYGSLGRIYWTRSGDEVVIRRAGTRREHIATETLEPRVAYVKTVLGADSSGLHAAIDAGARGIVIEGFAGGEITPGMVEGVVRALRVGISVVVAGRAPNGRPNDVWTEPGGGGWLRDLGVLSAGELSGPKARIKLMLALGIGDDGMVRDHFG
ncbi:MAG: asparaginase [Gaiellaceae bacterium]